MDKKGINLHLKDALRECESKRPDIKQIEHNLYEIKDEVMKW